MDKEMIERCSDAVDRLPAFDFNNHEREQIVMAVIKAMREPTVDMVEAGLMRGTNLTTGQPSARLAARSAGERMRDQWNAMIDAITGAE